MPRSIAILLSYIKTGNYTYRLEILLILAPPHQSSSNSSCDPKGVSFDALTKLSKMEEKVFTEDSELPKS